MESIYRMAAFVALEMCQQQSILAAKEWLAHVWNEPKKWEREAKVFDAAFDGDFGYDYHHAARAVLALLDKDGK